MGDHYLPQYYLKGFCDPATPSTIYRYERGSQDVIEASVKAVAQEKGYYSPDVETYLANQIEGPANGVLRKLRERRAISPDDKLILSKYMATMLKRVPHSKERLRAHAPESMKPVLDSLETELLRLAEEDPTKRDLVERRRVEIRKIEEEFQREVPKDIWLAIIPPEATPGMLAAINTMTWLFWTCPKGIRFVTGDNPVFHFERIGIGKPESEISFPISCDIALWATWRTDLPDGFREANQRLVREFNRRTISAASRYVLSSLREQWLVKMMNKPSPRLNFIR